MPNYNFEAAEAAYDLCCQGKHVSEIAQPTKVHPGKLGRYCRVTSIDNTNVTSSCPPPPRYESYIHGGVPGRIC